MKELLSPNSVAVIGASNDETKLGGMLVKNMLNAGFKGKLYPINPKGGEIMGLKAYPSVTDVGEPIDLAVVAVKAALVEGEVRKMKEAGIKYAAILTAGFKEDSPEGAELEKKLVQAAKEMKTEKPAPVSDADRKRLESVEADCRALRSQIYDLRSDLQNVKAQLDLIIEALGLEQ